MHTSLEETRQLIYISTPTDIDPWKRVYAILLRPEASKQSSDSTTPTESEKPRMIGVLGTPHELELSYKLHPDFWGRGYMSEALKAFINLFWEGTFTFRSAGKQFANSVCREYNSGLSSCIRRPRK